jgi:DNA-binding transcriptional LysR family regulator
MDTANLRAFVVVAREGNLTRAARELHLSQPAVSQQIKQLQETLQLVLFTRTGHGMRLTSDGLALLPHAERAVTAAGDVLRAAGAIRSVVRGTLRIGTILDPGFLRLGAFLKALVETHPQVGTVLRHGMSGWVSEEIRSGRLDVGFYITDVSKPQDPGYYDITLTRYEYLVVAPAGWADTVARLSPGGWPALATLPWIWTPPASAHHRLLTRVFDDVGVRPAQVAEVDQEASMLELVKSGVGLSLVRKAVAIAEAHMHGLKVVEGATVPAALVFRCLAERHTEPPIASAFRLIDDQWRR